MATLTASTTVSSQQPRIGRGPERIDRVQTYQLAAALANTDVIIFPDLKVPHGALIHDIQIWGRIAADGAGTHIFEAGIHGGTADLFGSATLGSTIVRQNIINGGVLPYRVSVSDDAALRYIVPTLRVDGAPASATATGSITMMVSYVMDT